MTSTTEQLDTVEKVIEAFGGPEGMRALFGGVPSRWSNFKANGRFPQAMHMQIYVAACKLGLTISPDLVGGELPPVVHPAQALPLRAAE